MLGASLFAFEMLEPELLHAQGATCTAQKMHSWKSKNDKSFFLISPRDLVSIEYIHVRIHTRLG